jgi:hypothetical protein
MSSLILVTCDSGAGHLKLEKLADRVLTVTHRLVSGPIPFDSAPEHFFLDQRRLYETEGLFHEPWWFEVEDLTGKNPRFKRIWSRLPEVCLQYDTITLWIDPDANAQLILLQLLDWLGQKPEIASRLWLKQAETPTGDRRFGDLVLPPTRIESADVALASRAWAAFRSSTPRAWAALEEDPDIARLPGLKRAVRQMLGELPDSTGLGATQRKMLALVERQSQRPELVRRGGELSACALPEAERGPERLIWRTCQSGERMPLWSFEIGEALCDLASAPVAAVSGVTGPVYSLAMHIDQERFRRFRESPVSLTPLGHRLVAGTDDWSRHNPVHRWWGGTKLTNDTLWRWDAAAGRLSAPG